jgi:hypothetical protein
MIRISVMLPCQLREKELRIGRPREKSSKQQQHEILSAIPGKGKKYS